LIDGEIERRLLVNYAVDPDAVSRLLPSPFRPLVVRDAAVAGICLIRLGGVRPRGAPKWTGLRSENAAHRIAVAWDTADGTRTGVYIPRRDSDSKLNTALGGRVFPGRHERAQFRVTEAATTLRVGFAALDGSVAAEVDVRVTEELTGSRLFADLADASQFFELGSTGYSPNGGDVLDGVQLRTSAWQVEAGTVTEAESSFFDDKAVFPQGTVELDSALIMRHVPVTWAALPSLRREERVQQRQRVNPPVSA
jgi:hypothetical protein